MAHLIFGRDEMLARWAAQQIPYMSEAGFGPCKAIGVATGEGPDAKLLAAVVYHFWVPAHATCMVSIAASSPRWATRGTIRALLSVPFEQYGVQKLWSMMAHTNERAIRFNKGIGFRQEAVLKNHFGRKLHGVVTRMLDKDFRRIYGDSSEPRFNISSLAA